MRAPIARMVPSPRRRPRHAGRAIGVSLMSAFVVDTSIMDRVLKAVSITDTSLTCAELDQLGRRFYQLNLDAVRYRYPDCRDADLPGFDGCERMPIEYEYSSVCVLDHASTIAAYKAVKLLIYQCS